MCDLSKYISLIIIIFMLLLLPHPTMAATSAEAPSNLRATIEEDGILLKWDPPKDTGGKTISKYVVSKGINDGNPVYEGDTNTNSYLDSDVRICEKYTYYYNVTVYYDGDVEGATSEIIVVETNRMCAKNVRKTTIMVSVSMIVVISLTMYYLIERRR